MGEKRNFAALDWVSSEISDTLKEARQSLEAYVEDPKDSTRIRFCLTHIHQVHGSLQMVEFHGASLLAEEMEQTAQAIMDNNVASIPEAQEVLMRALLQLPIFLDHVKSSKEDNPARVMPLLNDLRAVRKQSYLSETKLFSPDLSSLQKVTGERHAVLEDKAKLMQVLKKLREMYQFAAASVLRDIKVDENLNYLDKVFSRLAMISSGTPGHPIWEVSAALIEALKRDEVELTVAVRGLLRYIARELRILGEKAPEALEKPPTEALLKNLLFYVARAEDGSAKVAAVKEKYGLSKALLGAREGEEQEDMMQAPDADAIRSVVVALQDELSNIKHILDMSLSGNGGTAEIKEVLPTVKRVADTLAVLGIGDLRKKMLEQSLSLEEISEANSIDDKKLMQTASNIIEIEHRLRAIGKSAGKHIDLANVDEREIEIDNAKAAVVKECASGLLESKDAIIEYISSQWDKQHLESVGNKLVDIRGGLNMIPLRRPAAIVDSCARYIEEQLMQNDEHPSFQALESLADAIASVEYYLERLMEDLHEDSDSMLDIAEDSVGNLGYPIEIQAVDEVAKTQPTAAVPEVEETPMADSAPVEEPESTNVEEATEEPLPTPDVVVEEYPEETVEAELPAELPAEEVQEHTAAQVLEEQAESDIDDEIIEIFIEEAGEVLDTLHEYYPKWRAKEADQDSLVVVRRAFHTLKGSGRMVEAFDIGELAWSVENMLNRVIDHTIRIKPHVLHLADAVIALIPTLVKAFEDRVENPEKALTEQYQAWGQRISEGDFPDELAEPIVAAIEESSQAEQPEAAVSKSEVEAEAELEKTSEEEEFDHILQEIFSQESVSHLETLRAFVQKMEEDAPLYSIPSDELQRALHTLKGSAKMAQVWPIAEITEPMENFTKELIAFQVRVNGDILQLIKDAVDYTQLGLDQIENNLKVDIPKIDQFVARTGELRDLYIGHLVLPRDAEEGKDKVDPRMLSLVMAEEMTLLLDADKLLSTWQEQGVSEVEVDLANVLNELSVLEEGARQANLGDMATLSAQLREAHTLALSEQLPTDDHFFELMHRGHDALLDMVDAVAAGQNVQMASPELQEGIQALLQSAGAQEAQAEEIQPDESLAPEADSPTEISYEIGEGSFDQEIVEYAETLNELGGPAEGPAPEEPAPEAHEEEEQAAIESPQESFEAPSWEEAEDQAEELQGELEEELEFSSTSEEAPSEDVESLDLSEVEEQTTDAYEVGEEPVADSEEVAAVADLRTAVIPGLIDSLDTTDEDFDLDIVEVFLEEADELVEGMDEAIHEWEGNWSSDESLEEIKRILHTLKGGARLSGMNNLGDLTHDYETMLIEMGEDFSGVDQAFFGKIHGYQDGILSAVRAVKTFISGDYDIGLVPAPGEDIESPEALPTEDQSTEAQPTEAQLSEDQLPEVEQEFSEAAEPAPEESMAEEMPAEDAEKTNVLPFEPKPKTAVPLGGGGSPGEFVMPSVSAGQAASNVAVKKAGPQEVVKVSAELLEELVNLAGETSINRSRLEQYINDFGFALDEVDSTLNRMQDQLRRLDMETEAQILFRQEQMEAHDEFDPLEMDRYSNLQQLSRSLIESASDLTDLKSDLGDRLKMTETLLLQQSRINTTLQEGLMRSRMVPFARLVPRLRRIVRQVSSELGKSVSFELDNVEGELDRSVLERMVPPFEHMLRNAVDHGIESPEERIASGKAESGRIVLTLSREGGDVIIRLADDGRGVDLKRVREKAVERGLMAADADLADHDIMQFILHAGFSTAENVTQISGRGVGMDVVHSEIKQLGGSVTINSAWGKGTEFVVRLPFTLSINRALMVGINNNSYAVPLSSIEGIVRVSPFELEHYYANPEAQFEYANENYHVRYLGSLLSTGATPKLEGHVLPLPVLLVRSAEHTMALQVDAVMGSREIVVKSLGQQFSTVPGLSGATVMGDGSVVVIIDPHALVRQEIARATLQLESGEEEIFVEEEQEDRVKQIMVVDDSVTVRKVTSRFLEREGFDVITAKDGVDALRLLQDGLPDLMLLDIEMPRMDGFEVAKTVRTTQRWKELPIIMITSRTGDKHRDHALSLGVNNYLGKPYQEDLLLEAIGEILDHKATVLN